jgi:hypothetical protein
MRPLARVKRGFVDVGDAQIRQYDEAVKLISAFLRS